MKVYLGADHRGFHLKEKLAAWLRPHHPLIDMGATSHDTSDDYTLYAEKVAAAVSADTAARGILLCGSGVGVDVVANKKDGVRASIGLSPAQVKEGRKDDDMNVLVIAADFTSEEKARELVEAFLHTQFDNAPRHERRLQDIKRIEENN